MHILLYVVWIWYEWLLFDCVSVTYWQYLLGSESHEATRHSSGPRELEQVSFLQSQSAVGRNPCPHVVSHSQAQRVGSSAFDAGQESEQTQSQESWSKTKFVLHCLLVVHRQLHVLSSYVCPSGQGSEREGHSHWQDSALKNFGSVHFSTQAHLHSQVSRLNLCIALHTLALSHEQVHVLLLNIW